MYFGAFTSGLTTFRSSPHGQQVNEHIFAVPQDFDLFAMFLTSLKLTSDVYERPGER